MNEINLLTQKIIEFRDKREWKRYHTPKNLVISLLVELGELLEYFQWKNDLEILEWIKNNRNKECVEDELADVLIYLLLLAHELKIDLYKATIKKIRKNEIKYPVELTKGNYKKYTELRENENMDCSCSRR